MKTKLLIFGITGDLSTRKLLPALDKLIRVKELADLELIGVSRREVDAVELVRSAGGSDQLSAQTRIVSIDLAQRSEYDRLRKEIALTDEEQLLIYLSVPPAAATQIADFLGEAGLNPPNIKILFEKPFGVDLISATEMIERTARYYEEEQIFRIDHYLAKEMAQNIVTFRGGNALITHVWNRDAIEKIEIIASEKIDIEGRTGFYEQTGALRDVVQGHLMQLLALVLMDIPPHFDWNTLPDLRRAALEQLRPADPAKTIRAQYVGYQQEVNNPGSLTETFVSLELASDDPRWADVPLVLITGKALDRKATELRVHFRRFHEAQSNQLVFRIQPNEGVEVELFTKKPGYSREFETQKLAFAYPEDTVLPDAYEQVLVDAIRAHKSLFTSSGEVLASWRVLQPLIEAWNMSEKSPILYKKGSTTHDICSVE